MRLVKLLSSVITEKSTPKSVLLEISPKLKTSLVSKFKEQTDDSPEQIGDYIEEFEKYKNGLPADKRDLSSYTYKDLKSLIETKKYQKKEKELFNAFKKKEEKLERTELSKVVRKFLEIQSKFGKIKDPTNYKFLDFSKLINQLYPKYIREILMGRFKKENTNLTDDILEYYVGSYLENFDELYSQMPPPTQLTFDQFEHYIDGMNKGLSNTEKVSTEDIETVYEDNNLIIFQPKTRDQCIKLKNGRSWCTSREGGSNYFYNYRLEHGRTLYYVIDQDKEYSDLNFAVVILVGRKGGMALADGSNSGRYSGHEDIPWDEIVKKIPKLKNLKDIFKPIPLTQEELSLIDKVKNIKVGPNPIEELGSEQMAELWLEINSPKLTDQQFLNLTPTLRKKYIGLGHDLSPGMIKDSDPDTKKYFIGRKLESIKSKSLNQLSDTDIAILNLPGMAKLKEDLKSKFATDFQSGENVTIKIPSQKEGKYIALYGFDDLIKNLSSNITFFELICTEKSYPQYALPAEFCNRFTNLETLLLDNIVSSLPDNLSNLRNLEVLNLKNNSELKTLPPSILQMSNLDMVIIRNAPDDFNPPKGFDDYFEDMGDNFYYRTKFD